MPLVFGNVPHPPFHDRLVPDAQTKAWDDLGPRTPVGVCQHSMVGSLWGTDGWFRRGHESDGLTDYGVGNDCDGPEWDGVIIRWNDPRGKAATVNYDGGGGKVSANRAGWANGGSDGLEGDGPLFVRTLGIAAINRDLVSVERSDGGDVNRPMSPKQFESICALSAHWFDQAHVPWDKFPVNPAHGVVTHLLHYEFATKNCPFPPVTNRIDEIQNRIRQLLKTAQTKVAAPSPVPPPKPVTPDHDWWPQGYDLATLAKRFGALPHIAVDGTKTTYGFDPAGAISNAWVARGVQERLAAAQLPGALEWRSLQNHGAPVHDLVEFANRWLLFRPAPDVVWKWIY
jgi:hypothetical protein